MSFKKTCSSTLGCLIAVEHASAPAISNFFAAKAFAKTV